MRLLPAFAGLLALLAQPAAQAALGETLASVQADGQRLKAATGRLQVAAGYSVQALQLPEGGTVSEYLSPAGVVFAVRWLAPSKPDLAQLLGRYFPTYASAPRSAGSDRNHFAIDADSLVVRAGGRQRAFFGMAWVPALVPAGVDPAVLP
jgi:hypothetical protein